MSDGDVLDEGRRASGRRAWAEAYDRLSAADRRVALGADDLERLATAAYLTGHDAASSDAWTRAHQARLDAGDPEGAVRCAFWLGFGFVQRGEVAQGGGWMARARSLVDERRLDCVESAYLLVPAALMALDRGDHDTAGRLFDEAGPPRAGSGTPTWPRSAGSGGASRCWGPGAPPRPATSSTRPWCR